MTTPQQYTEPGAGQPYGQQYGQPYPGHQSAPPYGQAQSMPGVPAPAQYARSSGPVGQVRSTGLHMLLFFVTFGIWSLVYYFQTHEEMKRHTGEGIGGMLGLVLSFFVGVASPFLLSSEVGGLYERSGRARPVSGLTGLWVFPGIVLLVLPIVWFVKTNGALNAYWRSLGAR